MEHSSKTKERVYRYLAEHGPSSSQEIERALKLSQSAVSLLLRGEADLRRVERGSALIYSKKQSQQRPATIIYTLADNIRSAADLYERLRATDPDDEPAIRELAELFIARSVRQTVHLEKLLKETDPEIYNEPAP